MPFDAKWDFGPVLELISSEASDVGSPRPLTRKVDDGFHNTDITGAIDINLSLGSFNKIWEELGVSSDDDAFQDVAPLGAQADDRGDKDVRASSSLVGSHVRHVRVNSRAPIKLVSDSPTRSISLSSQPLTSETQPATELDTTRALQILGLEDDDPFVGMTRKQRHEARMHSQKARKEGKLQQREYEQNEKQRENLRARLDQNLDTLVPKQILARSHPNVGAKIRPPTPIQEGQPAGLVQNVSLERIESVQVDATTLAVPKHIPPRQETKSHNKLPARSKTLLTPTPVRQHSAPSRVPTSIPISPAVSSLHASLRMQYPSLYTPVTYFPQASGAFVPNSHREYSSDKAGVLTGSAKPFTPSLPFHAPASVLTGSEASSSQLGASAENFSSYNSASPNVVNASYQTGRSYLQDDPTSIPVASFSARTFASKSREDRNFDFLTKLIQNFPADKKWLVSPMRLSNERLTTEGIHVFVDASNILIGFREILRRNNCSGFDMSFDSLVLLLERRRPIAKRVYVGSTRVSAPISAVEKFTTLAGEVGYEKNVYEQVYKVREPTPRQKFFKDVDRVGWVKAAQLHSGSGSDSETGYASPSTSPPSAPKWVEQGVDETLHLKMCQSIIDAENPTTMVLATGDGAAAECSDGFLAQVERALKKGWNVELVSWKQQINGGYKNRKFRAKWGAAFKIIELDDYLELMVDA